MADATRAQIGAQTTLSYWDTVASPAEYAELGPVRSIAGLGASRPEVDSTTLDSEAVERIGGLPDGKTLTITFAAAAENSDLVEGWVNDGDPLTLKIEFPAPLNETRYCDIVPLDFDYGTISASGLIELTLSGRITGAISSTDPNGS
jgi:hypothetical protein